MLFGVDQKSGAHCATHCVCCVAVCLPTQFTAQTHLLFLCLHFNQFANVCLETTGKGVRVFFIRIMVMIILCLGFLINSKSSPILCDQLWPTYLHYRDTKIHWRTPLLKYLCYFCCTVWILNTHSLQLQHMFCCRVQVKNDKCINVNFLLVCYWSYKSVICSCRVWYELQ